MAVLFISINCSFVFELRGPILLLIVFHPQALGISQYTKNAQKLGNPNSNIRGGPDASKSAGIDYQSMGIRGVVDNYRKQAAPNANIRGGPEASKSAKMGMDSMDMKAVTSGPKRDYNINKNIKG